MVLTCTWLSLASTMGPVLRQQHGTTLGTSTTGRHDDPGRWWCCQLVRLRRRGAGAASGTIAMDPRVGFSLLR